MQQRPTSLLGAAGVQAADAVIVLAASVLAGIDAAAGQSYQKGSGIALTLIGLGTAAALAWVALGLYRARRWSRTPAALTQLFVGIVGIYLVQGHRYAWGIPSLVLACAGFALLLTPASLRALAARRPGDGPGTGAPSQAAPRPAPGQRPGQARVPSAAKNPAAGSPAAKNAAGKNAAAKNPAGGKPAAKNAAAKNAAGGKPAAKNPAAKPRSSGKRPARG
jgi:hypothetical protein